jgi:hypothetical protein
MAGHCRSWPRRGAARGRGERPGGQRAVHPPAASAPRPRSAREQLPTRHRDHRCPAGRCRSDRPRYRRRRRRTACHGTGPSRCGCRRSRLAENHCPPSRGSDRCLRVVERVGTRGALERVGAGRGGIQGKQCAGRHVGPFPWHGTHGCGRHRFTSTVGLASWSLAAGRVPGQRAVQADSLAGPTLPPGPQPAIGSLSARDRRSPAPSPAGPRRWRTPRHTGSRGRGRRAAAPAARGPWLRPRRRRRLARR